MKPIRFILTLLAGAFAAASTFGQEADPTKLRILTSFLPLQAHTSAIAGDDAIVEQLLGKDTGAHDFQPTASDIRKLAEADLFIINGAGIEDWLETLLQRAANKKLVVVDTSKGVTLLKNPEVIAEGFDEDEDGHSHEHSHAHSHDAEEGINPHTWLDPIIAQQQVRNILAALQKADPANAAAYAKRAEAYLEQLAALDADFRAALDPLPNKNLVTFHEAFPYLADRYGFRYLGSISEFPEKDPTPKALATLVDRIKELQVGVLFAEADYEPELLKKIAAQTGARVSQLDTLEVGIGTPTAYIERMRENLEALRDAFQPPTKE